jgi:hypothetical protein
MRTAACTGVAIGVLVAAGCNDNDLGVEKRRPNNPPDTILSSGPPDSIGPGGPHGDALGTTYRVHFYWAGTDLDGTIDHFDFILLDHPAIGDSIAAGAQHRIEVEPPAADDPRWMATSATDSVFVTRADVLRRDPRPIPELGETTQGVLQQSFERWHTLFVRAVDNEGVPDPTPVYRSFNSTTLAPSVALLQPVSPGQVFHGPPVSILNWDGADPVGDLRFQKPIGARWALIPSRPNGPEWEGWPEALYVLPESAWSPWHRWDAADGLGLRAVLRNLKPPDAGGGYYIFAVQAIDEAGAVTPVFDYATPGQNNAVKIVVGGTTGPLILVDERYLGRFTFSQGSPPQVLDIGTGQTVRFRWRADASRYGGTIVAYRYGWNIRNLEDDQHWEQGWSASALAAPSQSFRGGTQRFFLEARDNAESVTRAVFELLVQPVKLERHLLIVDDTYQPQGELDPNEAREDQRWAQVVDSLVARRPSLRFDPSIDVFDVNSIEARGQPPPLRKVFEYKAVVWLTLAGARSKLRQLAQFFDPFIPANANRTVPFNYLFTYLENGGRMWVSGDQPAHAVWPLPDNLTPVDLPGWDDPVSPHPEVDSVGTTSFLYKMGVEAFDVGGGGRAEGRNTLQHQCKGLRRAVPQGFATQTFESSPEAGHQHTLVVRSADVEALPLADVTYTTSLDDGHVHTLQVDRASFKALQRNEAVLLGTSTETSPEPHTHFVRLVDQAGLWGAPPILLTGSGWASPGSATANPWLGRPNVEIYNMPSFMTSRQPPLSPPPWRSIVLYTYISPVPADTMRGVLYPQTADGQPVVLLSRRDPTEAPYFSRAWCGFEPYVLSLYSHVGLADYILLRKMGLGTQ